MIRGAKLFSKKLSKEHIEESNCKRSHRKNGLKRLLLSRDGTVTSPVNNQNPAPGFILASQSEPDLTTLVEQNAHRGTNMQSYESDCEELYPINTAALRHMKTGESVLSTEYLELISTNTSQAPLQQDTYSEHSSSISLSLSHCSLEPFTSEEEEGDSTDFAPVLLVKRKLQKPFSRVQVLGVKQRDKNDKHLLATKHTDRVHCHKRTLSSPIDAFPPSSPSAHDTQNSNPTTFYHLPSQPKAKSQLTHTLSKSHNDLSPQLHQRTVASSGKVSSIHLPKSLTSACQLFKPRTTKYKLNKKQFKPSARDTSPSPLLERNETTLEEYCEEQDLQLRASNNLGVYITPHLKNSFLDSPSQNESLTEQEQTEKLAATSLEAHYNEHLQWGHRKLRSTSMWSTSGLVVPPSDPTQLQFECEVFESKLLDLP